jgi:hypothetical protein
MSWNRTALLAPVVALGGSCVVGVACGRDADCGSQQVCFDGGCEDTMGRYWNVDVRRADAGPVHPDGYQWDSDGSPPDLYAEFGLPNDTCLTSYVSNSYDPEWFQSCDFFVPYDPDFFVDLWGRVGRVDHAGADRRSPGRLARPVRHRHGLVAPDAPMSRFRAVAVDYDGTLTTEARSAGIRVLLVTGRILADLRAIFPEVDQRFDAVVAENGAVLARGGEDRLLAPPVDPWLADQLELAGVPIDRGRVLLATHGAHARAVLDLAGRLGVDVHLLHNRAALMVLPAQVSKGSGLVAALAELGLTAHDCAGIGDAENDHALLDACEVGLAVGDAIDALRRHADRVLELPDGAGVAAFLRSEVRGDGPPIESRRWQLDLGTFADGSVARIPGSGLRVLVCGESGTGKSFVAGLLAERAMELGYHVCAIDPEGDHPHLGERPGVVTLGGAAPLGSVEQVVTLLAHGVGSVVVDLSLAPDRDAYARELLGALLRLKADRGVPHWILVDEAHVALGRDGHDLGPLPPGLCLVTWHPEWLCDEAASAHDVILETRGPNEVLLSRSGEPPRAFRPGRRSSRHLRHWHKYVEGAVQHRFWFRAPGGRTGRSAGNLREFDIELRQASDLVIGHHVARGDFSRWVVDVVTDRELAEDYEAIESRLADDPARARLALCEALERRYPGLDG